MDASYSRKLFQLIFSFNFLFCLVNFVPVQADDNPYRHIETLDRAGTYNLEWVVDLEKKRIIFNVTAKTSGYIGFGLTRTGRMPGADIVVGGIGKDGKPYFDDYHAVGNSAPIKDPSQDWTLLDAWERGNLTSLLFSRAIDTCDVDHDYVITDDLTRIIWCYGETDQIGYHHYSRGVYNAYLLDPDLTPRSTRAIHDGTSKGDIKVFTLRKDIVLSQQETQYQCTFHKIPLRKNTKAQIVGFNVTFPSDRDRTVVHHILLHRCRAPPGWTADEFFGPASRSDGSECYIMNAPNPLPISYCREVTYLWAIGGKPIFFSEHTGIPLDTSSGQDEVLMFQAHYNNPSSQAIPVTVDLDIYYTEKLRKYNLGVLQLGSLTPAPLNILIPPMSRRHSITGHCPSGCTQRIFPEEGINIVAAALHTHQTGIAVTALHLRNGKELPWISADDNYDFDFQQFRTLRQEVKALRGDQIIIRCTYDTTGKNGTTMYGGFSTRQEMCTTFMYYYSHSPGFALCRSEIRTEEYNFGLLGVGNMTWDENIREMVITDPISLRGTRISHHVNNNIRWDLTMRERLVYEQKYQPQISLCPRFHYTDPSTQLRNQLDSGILQRTGRIPGSDGRPYTSVDEDFEHESRYPKDAVPYERPLRCTRKRDD